MNRGSRDWRSLSSLISVTTRMERIKGNPVKKSLTLVLTILILILAGCNADVTPTAPVINIPQSPLAAQPAQFYAVTKDGVKIACPKHWQTYSSDPSLIYGVSRADTIRIVVGVLPAVSQSYYDSLVTQGAVFRTTIAGYPAYRNDYTYTWSGHQVTNICVSVVQGDKACHFMFLCDTSQMAAYQPIFDYVLNSLKFLL
jgi:hypothetical protein